MHRHHRFLIASLVATALIAACAAEEPFTGGTNPDGGPSGDPGSNGPNGPTGGGVEYPDGAKPGTTPAISDADVDAPPTSVDLDGAVADADLPDGAAPEDAAAPDAAVEDSGSTEDAGVVVVDGPDVPPVAFPTTTPPIFGYTLQDAYPGMFLSGAMDMEWPAGTTEPYVLQRGGHIVRLRSGTNRDLVLNFEGQVAARGEGGTLGMALHPKFASVADPHPYVYVWYNAEGAPTKQRLSRFTYNTGTKVFDLASQFVLVEQTEQATEHNGARLRFGPDGFLYFGNGDDTRADTNPQKLNGGLFSGVFRIDVDKIGGGTSHAPPKQPVGAVTQGYFIPNDNPFVGVVGASEEYFALGFRNPYSFTFDRGGTNALWLGDVGDTFREEIDQVVSGGNYGWPYFEGNRRVRPGNTTIGTLKTPVYDYTHASIGDLTANVIGFVYRGAALPELTGKLIFSDWPTGRVWALDTATGARISLLEHNWQNAPVSFGQDAAGEIYLIAWSKILKLVRAAPAGVPLKLSDTKLFRNLSTLKTSSSLVPYSIRSPLWSDGASKERWVYLASGTKATMTASGTVTLPAGSMLVKQFDLPPETQPVTGRSRRLETRVLVVGTDTTYGVTYRWNAAGTDADLVIEAADETIDDVNPAETRTWHFPSAGECWSCHRPENRVIGFRGEQLNFTVPGGSQLAVLEAANVFNAGATGTSPAPIASPADGAATIDARAGAYFAANCSSCHHPGASYLGGATWNALPNVAANSRGLIGVAHNNYPMASELGLPNAPLVKKGDPDGSILMQRMKSTHVDLRMPALGRTRVDPLGVSVIDAWIRALP